MEGGEEERRSITSVVEKMLIPRELRRLMMDRSGVVSLSTASTIQCTCLIRPSALRSRAVSKTQNFAVRPQTITCLICRVCVCVDGCRLVVRRQDTRGHNPRKRSVM